MPTTLPAPPLHPVPVPVPPDQATHQNPGSCDPVLHCGDWVAVRGLDEILATLDSDGKLEGVPFMPEMIPFAGQTLRVHRRVDRTCVEGAGNRRMERTVFLEGARCNGSAHDGCERRCLFFWKEAWLRPAAQQASEPPAPPVPGTLALANQRLARPAGDRYFCQSTELAAATTGEFEGRHLSCYLRDLMAGETTLRRFALVLWEAVVKRVLRGGPATGNFEPPAGNSTRTTSAELNLQPGEIVEVKSLEEIKQTLDAAGRNRGLAFDPEMGRHCGKRFRVLGPIRRMISEETGKMLTLNNTVLLEGLTCEGFCVYNCPRANYFFWRECWLKRVRPSA